MIYCLYEVTNSITGKIYVGAHGTEDPNDYYLGSGVRIKKAIKKHGPENFSKRILEEFESAEDLMEAERQWVDKEFVGRKDTYNIRIGGGGGSLSDVTKRKMTGKIWIHNSSGKQKRVVASELESFEKKGWKRGVPESFKGAAGKIWIHNSDGKQKRVVASELESFLENGWIRGVSEVTKRKIGSVSAGRVWIHNSSGKQKRVGTSELEAFLKDGWIQGMPESFKSTAGKVWIHNSSGKQKRVVASELESFLKEGWVQGRNTFEIKEKTG